MDAYDNDQATYLVALDDGRVIGGLRLYPTLLPHMISESFAHLVRGRNVLSGLTVLECTRYFIIRERRMGRTDCQLLAAFQQPLAVRATRRFLRHDPPQFVVI